MTVKQELIINKAISRFRKYPPTEPPGWPIDQKWRSPEEVKAIVGVLENLIKLEYPENSEIRIESTLNKCRECEIPIVNYIWVRDPRALVLDGSFSEGSLFGKYEVRINASCGHFRVRDEILKIFGKYSGGKSNSLTILNPEKKQAEIHQNSPLWQLNLKQVKSVIINNPDEKSIADYQKPFNTEILTLPEFGGFTAVIKLENGGRVDFVFNSHGYSTAVWITPNKGINVKKGGWIIFMG